MTDTQCPLASAATFLGDKWNLLILRDLFLDLHRFDDFRKNLAIAPTILSKRLNQLCEQGIIEKRRYQQHPPRDEYHLTDKGAALLPILLLIRQWGHQQLQLDYPHQIIHTASNRPIEPVLIDKHSGQEIHAKNIRVE